MATISATRSRKVTASLAPSYLLVAIVFSSSSGIEVNISASLSNSRVRGLPSSAICFFVASSVMPRRSSRTFCGGLKLSVPLPVPRMSYFFFLPVLDPR